MEKTSLQHMNQNENDKTRALAAAYALNMCTVSVSQIIDYNDPIILEQEYEGILNNLNLQVIPKEEEALLDVLKKILDTITFFRINDKEKEFVDREYQQKMKNAIWNAVPNIGLIVAGGNPVTMAISLASQIGIGYMNYRKAKSENSLQYDRDRWQLERAAIEQLNGLRRQLFDASWKMTDTYDLEDRYRLTEWQIQQYNKILLDPDNVRKYERLENIKTSFDAYPPFWYYLGNSAQRIALDSKDDEIKKEYQSKAKAHFETFWKNHDLCEILRKDPIASACALEYIDLLDTKKDKEQIQSLLSKAVTFSGNENDVLQLCAFAYLKTGKTDEAEKIFRQLVNENYNSAINGQLLSRIYVGQLVSSIKENDDKTKKEYRNKYVLLSQRIDSRYLFPIPSVDEKDPNLDALNREFENNQRRIIMEEYFISLKTFFERCNAQYNHAIPVWQGKLKIGDSFYTDTEEARKLRIYQAKAAFSHPETAYQYRVMIEESDFRTQQISVLEHMVDSISQLGFVSDIEKEATLIKTQLTDVKDILNSCTLKLVSDAEPFDLSDYIKLQNITYDKLSRGFIGDIFESAFSFLKQLPICGDGFRKSLSDAESDIFAFCVKEKLQLPEMQSLVSKDVVFTKKHYFTEELINEEIAEKKEAKKTLDDMLDVVRKNNDIITDNKKAALYLRGSNEFNSYFCNKQFVNQANSLKANCIAVIDDRTFNDTDLLLTTTGVTPIVNGRKKNSVLYSEISFEKLNENKVGIKNINYTSIGDQFSRHKWTLGVALLCFPAPAIATEIASISFGVDNFNNLFRKDDFKNKGIDMGKLVKLFLDLSRFNHDKDMVIKGDASKFSIYDHEYSRIDYILEGMPAGDIRNNRTNPNKLEHEKGDVIESIEKELEPFFKAFNKFKPSEQMKMLKELQIRENHAYLVYNGASEGFVIVDDGMYYYHGTRNDVKILKWETLPEKEEYFEASKNGTIEIGGISFKMEYYEGYTLCKKINAIIPKFRERNNFSN